MATYRGTRYEAGVGPTDADIVLFTSSPPAEEAGFEPGAGHWHKRVSRSDVDALWECRPVGQYRSQPCLVLEEIGDRLHITHLGHDVYQAERLGYWQVDRGVYEVVVPHDEVSGLTEERVEYPVHRSHDPAFTPSLDTAFSPPASQEPPASPEPLASQEPLASPGPPASQEPLASSGPLVSPGLPASSESPALSVPSASSVPPTSPVPLASPWSGYKPAADKEPPPNGASAADPAGSQNGVADALAEPVPDELSGLAWMDTPDRLPPPRPLPKRRRPAARPSGLHLPDPPDSAAGTSLPVAQAPAVASAAEGTAATLAQPPPPPQQSREQPGPAVTGRRRRARVETRWVFRDLVDMAAIPHGSYAVDEEVDGALCLIKTDDGYEVFSAIDGTKHELRFFDDEEAAYFYLFGVLTAEAIRGGRLMPKPD